MKHLAFWVEIEQTGLKLAHLQRSIYTKHPLLTKIKVSLPNLHFGACFHDLHHPVSSPSFISLGQSLWHHNRWVSQRCCKSAYHEIASKVPHNAPIATSQLDRPLWASLGVGMNWQRRKWLLQSPPKKKEKCNFYPSFTKTRLGTKRTSLTSTQFGKKRTMKIHGTKPLSQFVPASLRAMDFLHHNNNNNNNNNNDNTHQNTQQNTSRFHRPTCSQEWSCKTVRLQPVGINRSPGFARCENAENAALVIP